MTEHEQMEMEQKRKKFKLDSKNGEKTFESETSDFKWLPVEILFKILITRHSAISKLEFCS